MGNTIEQKLVEFLESNEYIPPETVLEVISVLSDHEQVYWSEVFQSVQPYGKPDTSDALIPTLGSNRIRMTNEILELFDNIGLVTQIQKEKEPALDGEIKHDTEPYVTTGLFDETEVCRTSLEEYKR